MCADAVDDETVAVSEALVTDMIKAGAVAGAQAISTHLDTVT